MSRRCKQSTTTPCKQAKRTEGKQARAEAVRGREAAAVAEMIPDPTAAGAIAAERVRHRLARPGERGWSAS